jgi:predicted ArsR family transcriptional regulator
VRRDALAAVAEPSLREAVLFARAEPEPFTADAAAEALGVHRNVARARLDRLVEAGLLELSFERRTGRSGPGAGRPAKVYRVAAETSAIEFPPRRLATLIGRLLDELPERGRQRALRRAGERFGRDLAVNARLRPAATVRSGVERMCTAVRGLGFQAAVETVDRDTVVLATPTCPLRPLVVARPEAAEIDRGMWIGLLERAVRGVHAERVECETRDCLNGHAACVVVLRLGLQASEPGATDKRYERPSRRRNPSRAS